MELNKVSRLILNFPSVLIDLDLVYLINLLNMSYNLLIQFLHLLGSLLSFKTDLAISG